MTLMGFEPKTSAVCVRSAYHYITEACPQYMIIYWCSSYVRGNVHLKPGHSQIADHRMCDRAL